MCDPVSATALLLSAGGTYLESRDAAKNQDRITNARNNAYQKEMIKQRAFADQSGAAFNTNIDKQGRESFDEEAAKSADQFKQAFGAIQTQPDYNNTGFSASTPKNVVIAMQNENSKADAKTNRDLEGLSALSGYGGAQFNQDLGRSEFGRLFGNIQDKAARQSALMPLEIEAAGNNASKGPSLFPTLLKGAGTALGFYGAANGISSFGDKLVQGPLPLNGIGPGAPINQPGLFTNLKQLPSKVTGGRLF